MNRSSVLRPALAAILFAATAVSPLPLIAAGTPGGPSVAEGLSIRSKILGKDVAFAVYVPPDYASSTRRYPVVYLLHGYTDDESGWVQFGEVGLAGRAAGRAEGERRERADHSGREENDRDPGVSHERLLQTGGIQGIL